MNNSNMKKNHVVILLLRTCKCLRLLKWNAPLDYVRHIQRICLSQWEILHITNVTKEGLSKTTQKFFYSIVLVVGFFGRIWLKSPEFFRKREKNDLKETKKPSNKNFFEKHRVLESNKCCKVGGVGLFYWKMLLCNICNMWHFPVWKLICRSNALLLKVFHVFSMVSLVTRWKVYKILLLSFFVFWLQPWHIWYCSYILHSTVQINVFLINFDM